MGLGTLAAEVAILDVFLGVIPGAATGGHGDGHEQSGDDGADEQPTQRLGPKEVTHQHRDQHRQQRRHDHFLDRRPGQQVHGARIVGLRGSLHDAGDLLELAPHLQHHRSGGTAHGLHRHGAEQIRNHPAQEQADDHHVAGQIESDHLAHCLQVVGVIGEQHQRRETRGADGVTLGDGLGGIAHCIQRVGDATDFRRQLRHFRDAAGVVGDGAIGIQRHDHAGHGQHGRGGNGDAIQSAEFRGAPDGHAHRKHRRRGGLHGNAQTGDDVGGVAGGGRGRHMADRRIFRCGVVLGDDDHGGRQREADQGAIKHVHGIGAHHVPGDEVKRHRGQHAGHDHSLVKRVHDLAALLRTDEEGANDGGNNRGAAQGERIHHRVGADGISHQSAQQHGGDQRHCVGLKQIRGHAGAIADIVTDVIRDYGRIARVVLGDAGLDLADQVRAHVRPLGEDTAAEPGED